MGPVTTPTTYTAAQMREAFTEGGTWASRARRVRDEIAAEACARYPDPAPVLTVREEPDPVGERGRRFRYREAYGFIETTTGSEWYTWRNEVGSLRGPFFADLIAYPYRLPDGRPCNATGTPKPETPK